MIEDSCPLSQSAAVDLSGGVSVSAGLLCISGIIPRIPDVVAGCDVLLPPAPFDYVHPSKPMLREPQTLGCVPLTGKTGKTGWSDIPYSTVSYSNSPTSLFFVCFDYARLTGGNMDPPVMPVMPVIQPVALRTHPPGF